MPASTADRASLPPRSAVLLPVALLVHQAEEWFGGFPEWTSFAVGNGVEPERFLLINTIGIVLITFWTLTAFREPGLAWIAASVATLLGVNGILHALATVMVGRYSPGTATGLLLSLPLSIVVLRAYGAALPRTQFIGAMLAGILFHGVVTFVALA